ncbi:transposase, partial [Candidatus Poribacteria bacterium]|nr:transposase [Candidatus Poribacteria bacterium]
TYIGLPDEYIYLASVIDVYSRKCVGWHICDSLDTSLALIALQKAVKSHEISISMSRKGCPQDNPFAESFIKTVKVEEVYLYEYDNRHETCERISHFIGDVYNQKRLHSSLGYMSPQEFEEQMVKSKITLA